MARHLGSDGENRCRKWLVNVVATYMAEAVTAYIGHDAMSLLMMVVNCLIRSPSHSRVHLRN